MNSATKLEHRASSSRSKHEGEPSIGLCDRLSRTRDNSQRQLPTDHDYAVPTREYQTDQSSLKPAQAAARSVLEKQKQRQKQNHRIAVLTRSLHISPLREMRTLSVVRTGLGWVAVQQRSTIEERTVERPFRACLQFFSFFLWLASSISADPRSSSGSVGTALSVTVGSSHTCMTLFPTQIRQGLASLGPL